MCLNKAYLNISIIILQSWPENILENTLQHYPFFQRIKHQVREKEILENRSTTYLYANW